MTKGVANVAYWMICVGWWAVALAFYSSLGWTAAAFWMGGTCFVAGWCALNAPRG